VELNEGDRFLLCSDGLDKHVHERDIATAMVGADLPTTARRLIDMALAAGATDNVTVCLVEVLP